MKSCPSCASECAANAVSCPKCGHRFGSTRAALMGLALAFVVLTILFGGCAPIEEFFNRLFGN